MLAKLHFAVRRSPGYPLQVPPPQQPFKTQGDLSPELQVYNQYCLDVSLADFLVIAAEAVIASTRARHEDANPGHGWGWGPWDVALRCLKCGNDLMVRYVHTA